MAKENYLVSRLQQGAAKHKDNIFIKMASADKNAGKTITYGEFFANAERVAAALVRAGVQPGDRVCVQAPKCVAMLELYVGVVMAGAVFLPLNTAYTASELRYFLSDAEPALFVCDQLQFDQLHSLAKACGVGHVWTIAADGSGTLPLHRDQEKPGFVPVPRTQDDLAAILYTSGTTGRSKGAMLTHRALHSNGAVLVDYWQFTASDVLIHALPIFHTHGLFVATNVILLSGASMIFMTQFDAAGVLDHMPEATTLMGVPTFYVRLLETEGLEQAARGMRLFISGSAPLLAETHREWQARTGHAILERYGMTETNMNTSNPYSGERRAGSVGFPLPGIEVKITSPESGQEVPKGEIGVLEVRGPNVFCGYWRMEEKTREELRDDGFFITGDLGRYDEDGYVHIVGRSKDLIISGGYNIYPKEIEMLLDEQPGVNESAVIGVAHPDLGEGVVAILVANRGEELNTDRILETISRDLARFKLPKRIFIIEDMPRNTMGKVQKNILRDIHKDAFKA